MKAKRWMVLIALIGFICPSLVWANRWKVDTIYEKKFDMEIEDVVLDSYEEQGVLKFYPKIVCLAETENQYDSLRGLQYFTGTKEIRILNPQGQLIKKLAWIIDKDNIMAGFGYTRNGNYFYVYSGRLNEGRDAQERIFIGDLKVYDNNGDLLYTVDSLTQEYETGYEFYLSPKDGSAIIKKNTNPYVGASYMELYDKSGKKLDCELTELEKYNLRIDIADNGKYMVSLSKPGPADPLVEKTMPTVLFLDSSGNILWEKSLKGKLLSGEGGFDYISANGSYVYASSVDLGEWIVRNGYVFNKKGELVMEVPGGCEPLCFSPDENYLLVNNAKPYKVGITKEEVYNIYGIALIDIKNKKIIFNIKRRMAGIPSWNSGGTISNDGKVSYVTSANVDINVDKGLGNRIFTTDRCVRVFDSKGNLLWDSEPFYEDYAQIIRNNARWHNSNLIYIWIDETRKTLQVKSVQFVHE